MTSYKTPVLNRLIKKFCEECPDGVLMMHAKLLGIPEAEIDEYENYINGAPNSKKKIDRSYALGNLIGWFMAKRACRDHSRRRVTARSKYPVVLFRKEEK